jgi:hypothetical protein
LILVGKDAFKQLFSWPLHQLNKHIFTSFPFRGQLNKHIFTSFPLEVNLINISSHLFPLEVIPKDMLNMFWNMNTVKLSSWVQKIVQTEGFFSYRHRAEGEKTIPPQEKK